MAQHTQGPWTLRKSGSFGWSILANWHGCTDSKIAFVDAGVCEIKGKFFDENAANARLIAAAPELLEACWAVLHHEDHGGTIDEWQNVVASVRAAIAKAEGTP